MLSQAIKLFDVIHGRMSAHFVSDFGSMARLLDNSTFANVIENVNTLRYEFRDNFSKYSQTALNLRTVPFTEEEIQAVKLISLYEACWISPGIYMTENNGILTRFIVGEDQDFELVEGECWVKQVPSYLHFMPNFDPTLGLTHEDFFYKHVLFTRLP